MSLSKLSSSSDDGAKDRSGNFFIAAHASSIHKDPSSGFVFGKGKSGEGYYSLDSESDCLVDACRVLHAMIAKSIKDHANGLAAMESQVICRYFGMGMTPNEKRLYDELKRESRELELMAKDLSTAIKSGRPPTRLSVSSLAPWWTGYVTYAYDARVHSTLYHHQAGHSLLVSGKSPSNAPVPVTMKNDAVKPPTRSPAPALAKASTRTTTSPGKSSHYRSSSSDLLHWQPIMYASGGTSTSHCNTSGWGGGGSSSHSFGGGGGDGGCGGGGGCGGC